MSAPRIVLLALATACLAWSAAPPAAPSVVGVPIPCHDYREIRRQLAERYGEAPVSYGVRSNGELLQVFASPRAGTWTIVSTSPRGLACILAAGRGWGGSTTKASETDA